MADYSDNSVNNDDSSYHVQYSGNEDQNVPLINDFIVETSYSCKFRSAGYNTSVDIQSIKAKRKLIAATSLCFVFMIAELIGGYFAGSLAIMADAAHLLSDCVSFIVALVAIWWARKPADDRMSFGYKRLEVIGAILSILGIWLLTTFLFYLAIERLFSNNFDIDADTMMAVSAIGVVMNVVMAFILHGPCHHPHLHSHSHSHSHNSKSITRHKYASQNNDIYTSQEDDQFLRNPNNNSTTGPSQLNGGNVLISRSDSICLYRSPSHSRTNSFSKKLTSHENRRSSVSTAMLHAKLTDAVNHRNSFDGTFNNHKHRNGHADNKNECEISESVAIDETSPSEFSKKNINIQAAVIHVLGDFIQSIGVFIAALVIKFYPSAKLADPICTFIFSIIVIITTVRIMKQSIAVILDAVPASIKLPELTSELCRIDGVCSVHHLNVWSISTNYYVMSAHIVIDEHASSESVLYQANRLAQRNFDIKNSTIQIERENNGHGLNNLTEPVTDFV